MISMSCRTIRKVTSQQVHRADKPSATFVLFRDAIVRVSPHASSETNCNF